MTIALRYAAYSDVGCLREGNEDSAYAGPYLLAVADGMGGHAGGEIASAIAVSTLMPLDDDVTTAEEMTGSLLRAVETANTTLAQRVREEPRLENMGTTLTAMLWSGSRVALVHVGDSRAYLLRGGEFGQITHDHTLVQTLVDEGKITEEEVATHPQRSLLLRALDGRSQVDPDISVSEAAVGDRYLLCSDGLSGVVSAETIKETLLGEAVPEAAARRLIDLANRGGGPDNITAVVADVIDTATDQGGPTQETFLVGAADQRREPVMTPDTPAGRAQNLNQRAGDTAEMDRVPNLRSPAPPPADEDDEPEQRTRRWWPMVLVFLLVVAVVAGAGYYFASSYIGSQYFIAPTPDDRNVAVYNGVNTDIAGFSLADLDEATDIPLDSLPENQRNLIAEGLEVDDRAAADERIEALRAEAEKCADDPECSGQGGAQNDKSGTATESGERGGSGSQESGSQEGPQDAVPGDAPQEQAPAGGAEQPATGGEG
ncbi:Stp1/IreP family PP2C-type Ser/Thr phosphatase [Nocardiopsis sp. CNT-189]|uniref:Stp1/IreP family PP2C-type Ser/Thr phosphatase n=1 Tax=Nocardiopsis oceanisediminis TaxID=2816862 RepID=UPI003B33070E